MSWWLIGLTERPKWPDLFAHEAQVISIALVADYWFDGDEEKALHFLRQYHPTLWSDGIPDTSRFNVRRRELVWVIEALRSQFRDEWGQQRRATPSESSEASDPDLEERIRLVDSAPVILTSRGRGGRTPTIEPEHRAEWYGVGTSQDLVLWGSPPRDRGLGSNAR